ncbi:MAG: hypothetical protein HY320_08035 [Armatimonadetes bacterium]|nr:hypothetical protein [Armatimonadota bacterium]
MSSPFPIADDLATGVAAAVAVTGELMVAGVVEAKSPWAPFNAVAPLLLTPDAAEQRGWQPVATPVGLGVTFGGVAAWAALHRFLFRRWSSRPDCPWTEALAAGALAAGTLVLFDYRLLPVERRPRFQRWLSWGAIAAKYAVLGAVVALSRPAAHP